MSNYNAFGTGLLQGIQAINSIHDRQHRAKEYKDNKAWREKIYGDQRSDRMDDLAWRDRVYGDKRSDRAEDLAHRNRLYADSRSNRSQDLAWRQQVYKDTLAHRDRQFGLTKATTDARNKLYGIQGEYYKKRGANSGNKSGDKLNQNHRQQIIGSALNAIKNRPELWDSRIKPALIQGLNQSHGQQIGQGKHLVDLQPTPDGKGVVPILSVDDGQGSQYLAPLSQQRSSDPNDPAVAVPGDLLVDMLMDAEDDTALRLLQGELQALTPAKSKDGNPFPWKLERVKGVSPEGDPIEYTIRRWPDGREETLELNDAGQVIPPTGVDQGGGDALNQALDGWNPNPEAVNQQPAPPPPPVVRK